MKFTKIISILFILMLAFSCKNNASKSKDIDTQKDISIHKNEEKGKLFIIGGGRRPAEMIEELIKISNFKEDDYLAILPMSSQEPDSAVFYASKQFLNLGISKKKIKGFNFKKGVQNQAWIDSLKTAKLIYISGGDQTKFMDVVLNTPIYSAIHSAYKNGSTIAGTSAGAAVMGEKMITGNQHKYEEYTGEFRTIETENIEITQGLGLLKGAIIDQHFIWRMRMNRLMSVAIEHPNETAIGIDESTAIVVEGDSARVSGNYQVVVIKNPFKSTNTWNGLLGGEKLELSIQLPGEKFAIH